MTNNWRQRGLEEAYGPEIRSTLVYAMAGLKDALEDLWLTIVAAFRR